MDYKIKINEALDQIEKLTGEGTTAPLRAEIGRESDPSKLFLKFQALRETLSSLQPEAKQDVSFTVKLKDGSTAKFGNLQDFFENQSKLIP